MLISNNESSSVSSVNNIIGFIIVSLIKLVLAVIVFAIVLFVLILMGQVKQFDQLDIISSFKHALQFVPDIGNFLDRTLNIIDFPELPHTQSPTNHLLSLVQAGLFAICSVPIRGFSHFTNRLLAGFPITGVWKRLTDYPSGCLLVLCAIMLNNAIMDILSRLIVPQYYYPLVIAVILIFLLSSIIGAKITNLSIISYSLFNLIISVIDACMIYIMMLCGYCLANYSNTLSAGELAWIIVGFVGSLIFVVLYSSILFSKIFSKN